jgi:hypothetical protein
MDAARRLYVAVPAAPDGFAAGSPYAGMVLRFESDGSVARDSRGGSPVLAHGYAEPASLVWSGTQNELWLAGTGADWGATFARLPLGDETGAWPRVPASADFDGGTSIVSLFSTGRTMRGSVSVTESLIGIDDAGAMSQIDARTGRIALALWAPESEPGGEPASAAIDGADIYIVLATTTDQVVSSSQIVRLRQRN